MWNEQARETSQRDEGTKSSQDVTSSVVSAAKRRVGQA